MLNEIIVMCEGMPKQLFAKVFFSCNEGILVFSRIRLYKSTSRGSQLTRICTGIPEAKEMMKLLGRSKSKKILIHLKRYNPGICGNYVGNFYFVKARKRRKFFSELWPKQGWVNKNRTERKKRILMEYSAVF